MSELLMTVARYDCPPQVVARAAESERLTAMLDAWTANVGQFNVEPDADVEDFIEQAARLEAAVTIFGPRRVWLTTDQDQARNLSLQISRPVVELGEMVKYGSQPSWGPHDTRYNTSGADRYYETETFRRHAGRETHICGHVPGPNGIVSIASDMANRGHRRLFVKATESKYGVFRIPIMSPGDRAAVERAFIADDLGWALVYFEGRPNAFLLQEHVDMIAEYRLFVVDHEIVTGAGCVEQHTPVDNEAQFDPKIETGRRNDSPVRRMQFEVDNYVDFGRMVVDELGDERPDMRDYTLDVALNPAGEPLVIEANSLLNSGLYASDPRLVTAALRDRGSGFGGQKETQG